MNERARVRSLMGYEEASRGSQSPSLSGSDSWPTEREGESQLSSLARLSENFTLSSLFSIHGLGLDEAKKSAKLFLVSTVVLIAIGFISKNPIFFALIAVAYWLIKVKAKATVDKKVSDLDRDYPAFLLSLASSVKTGLDPLIAICRSGELFQPQSQIRLMLERFKNDVEGGMTEEQSLKRMAQFLPYRDLQLFATAFLIARREGSSLNECLKRLARVSRQRQSFARKVKGAVAMQKLSAFGIGGCAVIVGAMQMATNPKAMWDSIADPVGSKLVFTGIFLVIAGIVWMLQMAKSQVDRN